MHGGSRSARCWRRLSQLDGRLARTTDLANLALSLVPLALFELHAPSVAVVGAVVVWAVTFVVTLPALVQSMVIDWRAGTRAKWRARILRSHVAELTELTVSLRQEGEKGR